jgi:hypothetical protein
MQVHAGGAQVGKLFFFLLLRFTLGAWMPRRSITPKSPRDCRGKAGYVMMMGQAGNITLDSLQIAMASKV